MFIEKNDLETVIRIPRLDQITDGDDAIVTSAIAEAIGIMINFLTGVGYDTQQIFNATGNSRDMQLVGWARYITLYKVYERVPDAQVPDRVVKNYDDTLTDLRKVSDGRMSMNLPRKVEPDGTKKTKFRWGSQPKRSH
jgi:hypothetical protein